MMQTLFMGLGGQELLIILLIFLLLFGGAKVPELMRGMGKGVKAFKDGMKEADPTSPSDSEAPKEEKKDSEL